MEIKMKALITWVPSSGIQSSTCVIVVWSLVAECIQKLPKNSGDEQRQCDSLLEQLQCLIDLSQAGQMLLVSIRVPPKVSYWLTE